MSKCDDILKQGFVNNASILANAAFARAYNVYIDATEFDMHQQAADAGIGIGTPVYGVPLVVGGSFSKAQRDDWKQQHPEFADAGITLEVKYAKLKSLVDADVLAKWEECARQKETNPTSEVKPQSGISKAATTVGEIVQLGRQIFVLVIMLILMIGMIVAVVHFSNPTNLDKLISSLNSATASRTVLMILFGVPTIVIALILTVFAIIGDENILRDRFDLGKQVLAVLVGIVGTIVGFYFGTSSQDKTVDTLSKAVESTAKVAATPPVAALTIEPAPVPGTIIAGVPFSIRSEIHGGTPPYKYTITFKPGVTESIVDKETTDGKIDETITIPADRATVKQQVTFQIDAKDKTNQAAPPQKDVKQSFTIQRPIEPKGAK